MNETKFKLRNISDTKSFETNLSNFTELRTELEKQLSEIYKVSNPEKKNDNCDKSSEKMQECLKELDMIIPAVREAEEKLRSSAYTDIFETAKKVLKDSDGDKNVARKAFDDYSRLWSQKLYESLSADAINNYTNLKTASGFFVDGVETPEVPYNITKTYLEYKDGKCSQATILDIGGDENGSYYAKVNSGIDEDKGKIFGAEGFVHNHAKDELINVGELSSELIDTFNYANKCIFGRTIDELLLDTEKGLGYTVEEIEQFKTDIENKLKEAKVDEFLDAASKIRFQLQQNMIEDIPKKGTKLRDRLNFDKIFSIGETFISRLDYIANLIPLVIEKSQKTNLNVSLNARLKAELTGEKIPDSQEDIGIFEHNGELNFSGLKMPPVADVSSVRQSFKIKIRDFVKINFLKLSDKMYEDGYTLLVYQKRSADYGLEAKDTTVKICNDFKSLHDTRSAQDNIEDLREKLVKWSIGKNMPFFQQRAITSALNDIIIGLTKTEVLIDTDIRKKDFPHMSAFPKEFESKAGANDTSGKDYFDLDSFKATETEFMDLSRTMSECSQILNGVGDKLEFLRSAIKELNPTDVDKRELNSLKITMSNFITNVSVSIENFNKTEEKLTNLVDKNADSVALAIKDRTKVTQKIAQISEFFKGLDDNKGGMIKTIIQKTQEKTAKMVNNIKTKHQETKSRKEKLALIGESW